MLRLIRNRGAESVSRGPCRTARNQCPEAHAEQRGISVPRPMPNSAESVSRGPCRTVRNQCFQNYGFARSCQATVLELVVDSKLRFHGRIISLG
eukprot:355279-Chlamydomonas_euryale.AAC.8